VIYHSKIRGTGTETHFIVGGQLIWMKPSP